VTPTIPFGQTLSLAHERLEAFAGCADGRKGIRGNLQDSLTDKVITVSGAVDKQTQRVAMKLEGNDSVVVDTSLYNLTNDEVPVLVHFSPDRQETRTLIRLKPPEDQGTQQP
jgi:hypothetical protein